jgi:hypothetical protein
MADIFISYASHDHECAKLLAGALSARGWSVWWDRKIPLGKSFDQVIEEALDAARCVVVLWSRASVASNWVKTEADEAWRRKILVPVLIEEIKPPLEFRRVQAANLADWRGEANHPELGKLFDSVGELAGSGDRTDRSARHPARELLQTTRPVAESNRSSRADKEVPVQCAPSSPATASALFAGHRPWVALGVGLITFATLAGGKSAQRESSPVSQTNADSGAISATASPAPPAPTQATAPTESVPRSESVIESPPSRASDPASETRDQAPNVRADVRQKRGQKPTEATVATTQRRTEVTTATPQHRTHEIVAAPERRTDETVPTRPREEADVRKGERWVIRK